MTAKIVEEGLQTFGLNEAGDIVKADVALVHVHLPGKNGNWCYVVIGHEFCWVEGLEVGCNLYRLPLHGEEGSWLNQIEAYLAVGTPPTVAPEFLSPGHRTQLWKPNIFLIAE
jgi:hypothetical protein